MARETIADKIVAYLAGGRESTPVEIAQALNLNQHSVRRETRSLALGLEIAEIYRYHGAPVYAHSSAASVQDHVTGL